KVGNIDFLADCREPQHFNILGLERSHKSKSVAEHDLVGRLAGLYFMQYAIRRRIEDGYGALFGIEHESVSTTRSETDRARAGFCLHARDHLLAFAVDHGDESIDLTGHVDRFAQFRQSHRDWSLTDFDVVNFRKFANVDY